MTFQTLYDNAMLRGQRSVPVIGRLGGGAIATVSDSQPFRVTGANAVVYQLRQPTGKVAALRCWLAEQVPTDVMARYRALGSADTLRQLRKPDRTPIIGTIALHADGIQIEAEDLRSTTRPVVVLDWLMGPTVLAAVDRACRSRDAGQISALANAWHVAVNAARESGFVHGDLTGDNAIVRPKEGIAFVDYDSAFWADAPSVPILDPALAYRHPRGLTTKPERADDFAALLVYASLRILAVWPELRAEHGQPSTVRGAGLLFQPRDLAHPDGSPLFGKLRVLNDSQVLGLVGILREACLSDPDNMPTFHEALALAENVASVPLTPPAPKTNRMSSLRSDSSLVDRVEETSPRPRFQSASISPSVEQLWPERQRNWRPERLVSLARAIEAANLPEAEAIWTRLGDEPGAGALLPGLEDLRSRNAAPTGQDAASSRASRATRRRTEVERRFANALDHDDRATLTDMALSGDLDAIEDLSEASTRRVVGALALAHLERALETDNDDLIIEMYDARVLADQNLLTPEQRNRVDLAFERRTWLDDMRGAIRERDLRAIDRLFAAMPDGADRCLRERERIRIARLREQETALTTLRTALASERDSDVIEALSTVERVGALIPDDLSWTNVSNAVDRYSLLMSVRRAAEQQPRDFARLARLLPQLKDAFGSALPGSTGGIDFARLDMEVKKAAQLERIREALATDDNRKILATALPDLYGVLGMLERGEQARVERAVAAANRALRRSGHRSSRSDASSETVETR